MSWRETGEAALPLTALTAWEGLPDHRWPNQGADRPPLTREPDPILHRMTARGLSTEPLRLARAAGALDVGLRVQG